MQPEMVRVSRSETVLILLEFQGFHGILAFGGKKGSCIYNRLYVLILHDKLNCVKAQNYVLISVTKINVLEI